MKLSSFPQSILIRVLLLTLVFSPLSCAVYEDPGYQTLLPSAEPSPARDAIVGMWHRKHEGDGTMSTASLYFKGDHTGYWDMLNATAQQQTDKSGHFHWSYVGNGVWKVIWDVDPHGSGSEIRLAGSRLLQENHGLDWAAYWVWDRVSQ